MTQHEYSEGAPAPQRTQATKGVPKVFDKHLKLAESERKDWVCNVPFGITLEDALAPEFWSHVAYRLSPYDHVELRAEDGTWIAKALVTGCDRTWARVHLMHEYRLTTGDVSMSQAIERYALKWCGPGGKWGFKRLSDGEVIKSGFQTKDEATVEMRDYERTVG